MTIKERRCDYQRPPQVFVLQFDDEFLRDRKFLHDVVCRRLGWEEQERCVEEEANNQVFSVGCVRGVWNVHKAVLSICKLKCYIPHFPRTRGAGGGVQGQAKLQTFNDASLLPHFVHMQQYHSSHLYTNLLEFRNTVHVHSGQSGTYNIPQSDAEFKKNPDPEIKFSYPFEIRQILNRI